MLDVLYSSEVLPKPGPRFFLNSNEHEIKAPHIKISQNDGSTQLSMKFIIVK